MKNKNDYIDYYFSTMLAEQASKKGMLLSDVLKAIKKNRESNK